MAPDTAPRSCLQKPHARVQNIQVVDAEISRMQQQLAIFQTARNAYSSALINAVKATSTDEPVVAKKVRKPRKAKSE